MSARILVVIVVAGYSLICSAQTKGSGPSAHTGADAPTEQQLRAAVRAEPDSPRVHGELGRFLLARGVYDQAVEELGRAVQLDPDSRPLSMALAEALIGWRHFPVAIEFLKAVATKFEKYPEYHYNLGLAFYNASRFADALREMETTVRLAPELDRAAFLVASCKAATGDVDGAADEYRRLVKLRPAEATYWLGLARVLERMSPDFIAEALAASRRALALRPSDPGAQFTTAVLLSKTKEYRTARRLLEHVVRAAPAELPAHVLLAHVYYRLNEKSLGDREAAIVRALQSKQAVAGVPPEQ